MTDLLSPLLTLGSAAPIVSTWSHDGPGSWIVFAPLFWIVLIATVILVLRRTGRWSPRRSYAPRESAIEVLDRRFAQGELSLEDYRERRAILSEQHGDG